MNRVLRSRKKQHGLLSVTLLMPLLLLMSFTGMAQSSGIFESYAILSMNGGGNSFYDMQAGTALPDLNGANLGTFAIGANSLVVKGGQNKTYKNGSCDITGCAIWYRVYKTGNTPGAFVSINEPFDTNLQASGDQQWTGTSGTTNLISSLSPGAYTLEVYSTATFTGCNDGGTHYSSNLGANYKATFTVTSTTPYVISSGETSTYAQYATLAAAVTAINGGTVHTGAITCYVPAGYTETAPAGGYSISATGTSTNPIVFVKDGSGTNPTFTSSNAQASGSLTDAVFKIIGGDYVTIDGFTMLENAANTTIASGTNNMTEFGVALFYATTTNGAQNCTIKNCTIDLDRTYQNSFGIYSNSNHTATNVTTAAAATGAAGANSNLTITGNIITDVNEGICIVGPSAAADFIDGLTIGTSGAGNSITNFGTTNAISGFTLVSGTVYGVVVRNAKNFSISYNTITSSNGGHTVGSNIRGIFIQSFSNAPTGTIVNNINNNAISIRSGLASATITSIDVNGTTGNATTTLNINNNDFNNTTFTGSGTGNITFIANSQAVSNLNTNNNTFTNISTNTTGSVTFFGTGITTPTGGTFNMNNNSIITGFSKTGAGGTVTIFTNNGSSPSGAVINNNGNNFSNITVTGATAIVGLSNTDGPTSGSNTKTVANNTFSNWTGGSSSITPLAVSFSGTGTVNGNVVSSITGSGAITGITIGANNQNVYGNTVHTLISSAGAVSGILVSAGTTNAVYQNKVYNLESGTASGSVTGISVTAGTTTNVYNNLIGDLRAPAANTTNAINGLYLNGGTTINAHFNTVYLNATSSSTTNFGSSAVYTNVTPSVTMSNNIFVNNSTALGTGLSAAHRRSGTGLTTLTSGTNNNLLYGSTIFTNGTNTDATLQAYKTRVTPKESASISENATFLSTTGSSAQFLHINPSTATGIESGGVAVSGITTDFDGQTRNATPDIGADEGTFTALPIPTITSLSAASGCVGSSLVVTGTNMAGVTSATIGGTAATVTGTTATTVTITVGTGTTGVVSVTSPSGTATGTDTFTVNALPVAPGNPTSNSPQCAAVGVTLTRAATPPAGETYYWQTTATGTTVTPGTNDQATFTVNTSGTYYLRAQSSAGCWSNGAGSVAVVITNAPGTAVTPSPANAATGVCYSGSGAITSIGWATVSGATSYDVYFASGTLPTVVTANVATNSYATGTLSPGTTYHWKVVAKNACGDAVSATEWTFTTAAGVCYCASVGQTTDGISGVTFNGMTNTGTGLNAYTDYSATKIVTVNPGATYSAANGLNVYVNTGGNYTNHQTAYIDWNRNGIFNDAGEVYSLGTVLNQTNGLSSASPLTIAVPAGAAIGVTKIRIQSKYSSATTDPCLTSYDGETEDYGINVVAAPVPVISGFAAASGCVGGNITINGTGLAGASAVTIGGTAVTSITSNSATQIVAVIGNGTTGIVSVTTGGGTATSSQTFTVNTPATATASSNSPVCSGSAINLTGTSNGVSFAWTGPNGFTSTAQSPVIASATAASAGTYTFTATSAGGCQTVSTTVVSINASPSAITITPSSATICTGASQNLVASGGTVGSAGNATIGSATTLTGAQTQPTAFCNRWSQYWNQTIYTKAELLASGITAGSRIQSITYTTTTQGDAATNANFSIRIGNTASTTLSAFQTTGLSVVYGPSTYTHAIGANTITFSSAFVWDGESNIVIDVRHDGADNVNNAITYFTAAADNKNISAVTSTTSATTPLQTLVANNTVSPTASTSRLNIVLGYAAQQPVWSWTPAAGLNTTSGNTVLATPASTTTYTATATINGCTATQNVTVTVNAPVTYYADADGDSYGNAAVSQVTCTGAPAGAWVTNNTDCSDSDNTKWQSGMFFTDADGDGYTTSATAASLCYGASVPAGYVASSLGVDCDDTDATKHASYNFYADADGDGFGAGSQMSVCAVNATTPPAGYSLNNTDCAPADATKWQSGMFFTDADGDGYTTFATAASLCYGASVPAGYVASSLGVDCDDTDATKHASYDFYADTDGDGFGTGSLVSVCAVNATTPPAGYSLNNTDCAPADATKWQSGMFFTDADGDGYTTSAIAASLCYGASVPAGYVASSLGVDCDDADASKWQSGVLFVDADGDGYDNGTATVCYGNTAPAGYALTTLGSDCNDANASVHSQFQFYVDGDFDGYGSTTTAMVCAGSATVAPAGYSINNTDCNDAVAAINPGHGEVLYNGVDDNCDGNLDEGNQLLSQVINQQCGITLAAINSTIGVNAFANITQYRYQVYKVVGGQITGQPQYVERAQPYFTFTNMATYDYATTYSIRVQMQRNGIWLGYYGPACQVSTPALLDNPNGSGSVNPSQCNTTLATIATLIATPSLQSATGYKFRITNLTDPMAPGQQQEITRAQNWFSLTMLPYYFYGTTYSVEVAVRTNGVFSGYGAACLISSPAVPMINNCDQHMAQPVNYISTASLNKVTSHRFEVSLVDANDNPVSTQLIDRTLSYFNFNMVPNYVPGGKYMVRVALRTTGYHSPFGEACFVYAPTSSRQDGSIKPEELAQRFDATVFPNPYAESFSLDIDSTSDEDVQVRVYDMIGKLLEENNYHATQLELQQFGEKYPSGVYNIVLTQGSNVKTLRVIKR